MATFLKNSAGRSNTPTKDKCSTEPTTNNTKGEGRISASSGEFRGVCGGVINILMRLGRQCVYGHEDWTSKHVLTSTCMYLVKTRERKCLEAPSSEWKPPTLTCMVRTVPLYISACNSHNAHERIQSGTILPLALRQSRIIAGNIFRGERYILTQDLV